MNRLLLIILLVTSIFLFEQKCSASSFTGRSYYSSSPSVQQMNKTINRLQSDFVDYNSNLQAELQSIQRNPMQNRAYDFTRDTENEDELFHNDALYGSQQNEAGEMTQNEQPERSDSSLKIQKKNPKWWRYENSFQGWGFN